MYFVTGAETQEARWCARTVDETTVQPTVREVLGREPRAFEQWVEENAQALHAAAA